MTGIVLGVGYSGGQKGSSCSHGPPKNSLRDISKMVSYLGSCITGQSRSHEKLPHALLRTKEARMVVSKKS